MNSTTILALGVLAFAVPSLAAAETSANGQAISNHTVGSKWQPGRTSPEVNAKWGRGYHGGGYYRHGGRYHGGVVVVPAAPPPVVYVAPPRPRVVFAPPAPPVVVAPPPLVVGPPRVHVGVGFH